MDAPTPAVRRVLGATAIVGFLALTVVLLWSDRAAAIFGMSDDLAAAFVRLFERRFDVQLIRPPDLPGEADQFGHAALWATGMMLAGFVLRKRYRVVAIAVGVGIVSVAFELAQPLLSSYRAIEQKDLVSNLTGVLIGAGATWLLIRAERKWWPQLA